MKNLPNRDKLLQNFSCCNNWEEKYLYIIELGRQLSPLASEMRTPYNLITACQSRVWIAMLTQSDGSIQLYGDSDAAIVKGLIAILFILYHNLNPSEIIAYDVLPFFNELSLSQYLTSSRLQGLGAMVRSIRAQAALRQ
ncbi:cysteine desulfuration protein SufE [Candidatus Gullanella endobia]|nr:cysteine desulfuration protein SufE [Candidatus Gullanella endobia]